MQSLESDIMQIQRTQIRAYYEGIKEGVRMFAEMNDGIIGSSGKTLKEILDTIDMQMMSRIESISLK